MAQYTPPLRDMQFVLHEVHGAIDALRGKLGAEVRS
jgi:hypothetical protein